MSDEAKPKKGTVKWVPKEWRIEYDRVVAYSACGMSNVAVAEKVGLTKEHVSTILNLPQAKLLMQNIQLRLRDKVTENIPTVLDEISKKGVQRIRDIIDDDEIAKKSPFAVAKLALDVMHGVGHLRGGGNGSNNQSPSPFGVINNTNNTTNIVLMPGQKSDIMDGFKKLTQVAEIHGTPKRNGTEG
jgi:hypothetical protein